MTMSSTVNVPATRTLNMLPTVELEGAVKAVLNLNMAEPFTPQAQDYIRGLGDARGFKQVALVGQAVAAILLLPAFEMLGGLPTVVFKGFGPDAPQVKVDLGHFRHNTVRSRRGELKHGEAFHGYTVLDGSGRGLTPTQLTELAVALGCEEQSIRVLNVQAGVKGQVDLSSAEGATAGMADQLVGLGLTVEDWTSGRVLFLPGGAGIVGALQATTIYGISESWPRTLRLNKAEDGQFHLAEVVDVQAQRQWAVGLNAELEAAKPTATLTGEIPEAFRAALAALAQEHGVEVRG